MYIYTYMVSPITISNNWWGKNIWTSETFTMNINGRPIYLLKTWWKLNDLSVYIHTCMYAISNIYIICLYVAHNSAPCLPICLSVRRQSRLSGHSEWKSYIWRIFLIERERERDPLRGRGKVFINIHINQLYTSRRN